MKIASRAFKYYWNKRSNNTGITVQFHSGTTVQVHWNTQLLLATRVGSIYDVILNGQ